jgi:GNAT superfamily N-acetyltransferase
MPDATSVTHEDWHTSDETRRHRVRDTRQMPVRVRIDDDLDACERLVCAVHNHDGYPRRLPRDLRRFIVWRSLLCAWVAEGDGAIVGHVALHAAAAPEIMALARRMTAQTPDQFGVVARLLVSPVAPRTGLGRRLRLSAIENACERGLKPMLEVTADLEPAIRLYEDGGWVCAGKVQVYWRSTDEFVEELLHIAPDTAQAFRGSAQAQMTAVVRQQKQQRTPRLSDPKAPRAFQRINRRCSPRRWPTPGGRICAGADAQAQPAPLSAERLDLGLRSCAPWEERGTWGENPSSHAGLRQGPRLSKTGVAALSDDLDHGHDQLLA